MRRVVSFRAGILLGLLSLSITNAYGGLVLHGFCSPPTPACADNGVNTPTSGNPPHFGFSSSGQSVTGIYVIVLLVPNNVANGSALSFKVSGTHGGAYNTSNIGPITASLVRTLAWTS